MTSTNLTLANRIFSVAIAGMIAILSLAVVENANADLMITLTEAADGSTNLEFMGTGQLIAGGDFDYRAAPGDDFYTGPILANHTYSPSSPSIAGGTLVDFGTLAAFFGSQDGFIITDPGWTVGGDLSTANDQVFNLSTLSFSDLNLGIYDLVRTDTFADVGDVQLKVLEVVPEPSSLVLLGGASLCCLVRRKRK